MKVFFIAAILFLQAQTPARIEPGEISGRLLTVDGAAAAGVRIAAVPAPEAGAPPDGGVFVSIGQTDANGRYRLREVPPGRYYIFAGLIDFPSYYPGTGSLTRADAILVEPGSQTPGVDFALYRPATVRVVGSLSFPPGVRSQSTDNMILLPAVGQVGARQAPAGPLQAQIEDDGSFEFVRVPPGEYRLASSMRGTPTTNVTVEDHDVLGVAVPVVDCNAGSRVSGRVVNAGSLPPQSVSLAGSRFGCAPSAFVKTDGTFELAGVPAGEYTLRLQPAPPNWPGMPVVVENRDVGLEVSLPPAIVVRGRVLVEDGSVPPRLPRGVPLTVQARGGRGEDVTQAVGEDGRFALQLSGGAYRFTIPRIPDGYFLMSSLYGLEDLRLASFEAAGTPISEIEVTLGISRAAPPGARLSGRVVAPSGGSFAPPESLQLVSSASRFRDPPRETDIQPDGTFEFVGVPSGLYNLETIPDSPAAIYGIAIGRADVSGIELNVPPLVKIHGGVGFIDGSGVTTALSEKVSVQFVRNDGNRLLVWAALAQSGNFQLYLPEGDYRVAVNEVPENFAVDSVLSGSVNLLDGGMKVRPGPDPLSIQVTLRGR